MQETHFSYEVALSYAHEDRKFVNKVARCLKSKGLRIFYDDDDQIESWGKDLPTRLDAVYRKESKFCVVFISKNYRIKSWTQFEHQILQSRALQGNRKNILPFRLDDTEIPGWPDTITYLSSKEYGPERLSEAILNKISENANSAVPPVNWKERARRIFNKKVFTVGTSFLTVVGSIIIFTDKLSPVETLSKRLYRASGRETQYSKCQDGSVSASLGGGACSHHGGVAYYFDTTIYLKTMKQCREEAMQISWWASAEP